MAVRTTTVEVSMGDMALDFCRSVSTYARENLSAIEWVLAALYALDPPPIAAIEMWRVERDRMLKATWAATLGERVFNDLMEVGQVLLRQTPEVEAGVRDTLDALRGAKGVPPRINELIGEVLARKVAS